MTTFIIDLTSDSVTDKELLKLIKDINKFFNFNKYIVHYRSYQTKTWFGFKTKTVERYDVYYDYNMNCSGDVQALSIPTDYNSVYSYLLGVYNGLTETKKMSKLENNSADVLDYQTTKKQTSSNSTLSRRVYKTSSSSNSNSSNTINNNHYYDSGSSYSSGSSSSCSDSSSSSSSSSCD